MQSNKTFIHSLYKKLITLYPKRFKEQFSESMQQTFNDLYKEKQNTNQSLFRFIFWTFLETVIGIFREYLLQGEIMQTSVKNLGLSALISLLLNIPFIIMEIVNRRSFNEEFPIALFFGMWLNLFFISLILLPILQSKRTINKDIANPVTQKTTLFTNSKSVIITSFVIILFLAIISLLASAGRESSEQASVFGIQVPSQFIALISLFIPIAAGILASRPIIKTLQSGGSLFAHPINLIIVVIIVSTFAIGFVNFLTDQWSCFIGVPVCD